MNDLEHQKSAKEVGTSVSLPSEVQPQMVPSYGLLVINHAYNEGKLTFKEWLELSREWALKIIENNQLSLRERPGGLD